MSVVRPALPADAEGIGEAHAEAWRIGYGGLFTADELRSAVEVRRGMWSGLVGGQALGGTLLVSEDGGTVSGFVHFGARAEDDQHGEVYGLYVHPSWWGTGSAQALMDEAVASLTPFFDVAVLWTHVAAARARRFYAKSDWSQTGNHRRESTWDGLEYPAVEYQRILSAT
jgi:GNAT superfamily N-acetyltransferase